jgi:hypothetical protein
MLRKSDESMKLWTKGDKDMYRALFELIGAFVRWSFSGFRGKLDNFIGEGVSYRNAFLGMLTFLILVLFIILSIKRGINCGEY